MLDAFIIEELRRREEQSDIHHIEQPRMEMPVEEHRRERGSAKRPPEEAADGSPQRGVIVIDY